jgi:hypothetical protein
MIQLYIECVNHLFYQIVVNLTRFHFPRCIVGAVSKEAVVR